MQSVALLINMSGEQERVSLLFPTPDHHDLAHRTQQLFVRPEDYFSIPAHTRTRRHVSRSKRSPEQQQQPSCK